jgi:hypothetical protein
VDHQSVALELPFGQKQRGPQGGLAAT